MNLTKKLDDIFGETSHCLTLFESRDNLLKYLNKLAIDNSLPVMIIGGAALPKYNYNRATEDIDLVMSIQNAQKMGDILFKSPEFTFIGHSKFKHKTRININFCPTGIQAGNNKFPEPESKIPGLQYASLPLLLAMKIQAKRQKDRGDFVELIKRNNLSMEYIEKNVYSLLNSIDKKWALLLWQQAQKELPI